MSKINDGGPAFPWGEHGQILGGMTLRDYAAIKFAASWALVLGSRHMVESREQRTSEANRLGLIQADAFIKARES